MPRLSFFVLTLALVARASAWIDTGHMVASAIAFDRLKPEVRTQVVELLKVGGDEKTQDFLGAACWADDVRKDRPASAPWHYINLHFRTDGKSTDNMPDPENAVVAIARMSATLKDRSKPTEERADALRFLMHFVQDLHQPLHCVARDSDLNPMGDRGGNGFPVTAPANMSPKPKNLHFLWDIAGGLYPGTKRPLTETGSERIKSLKERLVREYGAQAEAASENLDPKKWSAEGLALAKSSVYEGIAENDVPTEAYLARAKQVCSLRLTVAGYRLAGLLNSLLGS